MSNLLQMAHNFLISHLKCSACPLTRSHCHCLFRSVLSSDLYIHHHEPIQFSPRRIQKKIHQEANKAAINVAIADLVAARKVRHGKRLIKSSHSYKNVIASLQLVGVDITYAALMKTVARALVEDGIAEIRIPNSSAESVGVLSITSQTSR